MHECIQHCILNRFSQCTDADCMFDEWRDIQRSCKTIIRETCGKWKVTEWDCYVAVLKKICLSNWFMDRKMRIVVVIFLKSALHIMAQEGNGKKEVVQRLRPASVDPIRQESQASQQSKLSKQGSNSAKTSSEKLENLQQLMQFLIELANQNGGLPLVASG